MMSWESIRGQSTLAVAGDFRVARGTVCRCQQASQRKCVARSDTEQHFDGAAEMPSAAISRTLDCSLSYERDKGTQLEVAAFKLKVQEERQRYEYSHKHDELAGERRSKRTVKACKPTRQLLG